LIKKYQKIRTEKSFSPLCRFLTPSSRLGAVRRLNPHSRYTPWPAFLSGVYPHSFRFICYQLILNIEALALIEHAPWSGVNKIWITNTEYLLLYGIIISPFYFLYEKKTWLLKLSLGFMLLLAISISLNYNYRLLVVDNSKSNALITSLQGNAKAIHVNCVVLRRNKAIILPSN
jgi:hypothetical protein